MKQQSLPACEFISDTFSKGRHRQSRKQQTLIHILGTFLYRHIQAILIVPLNQKSILVNLTMQPVSLCLLLSQTLCIPHNAGRRNTGNEKADREAGTGASRRGMEINSRIFKWGVWCYFEMSKCVFGFFYPLKICQHLRKSCKEKERGGKLLSSTKWYKAIRKKAKCKKITCFEKTQTESNVRRERYCDMFFDKDKLDISFSIVKIWICWVKLGKKYCNVSTIY